MSLDALRAGVRWDFESFPDYLDMLDRQGMGPNVAAFVGHSSVRTYVLGDGAATRVATDAEISQMQQIVREAMAAGAVGFAVSVGLYLPTLLIGAGRLPTVTTEAVALAAGGNRRAIGVYAFLQMALPFLGFAIATLVPALLFRRRRALGI